VASLYKAGWRQGSILIAQLPLDAIVLDSVGRVARRQSDHGSWVVASQDCDLDLTDADESEPTIELRPVQTAAPPPDWGLRSAAFRLTEAEYIESLNPRTMVAAAVLTAVIALGAERRDIGPPRRQALTTWLGLRYDRPAVPESLLPLAKKIAEEVGRRQGGPTGERVRDVLMQFDEINDPVRFSLFAVLRYAEDEPDVREWLATIAMRIPAEMGIADEIHAAPATGISLHVIETSYAADVSRLTWPSTRPEPTGAT